jgi:glutamate-1-semialdehyde aminotransferase
MTSNTVLAADWTTLENLDTTLHDLRTKEEEINNQLSGLRKKLEEPYLFTDQYSLTELFFSQERYRDGVIAIHRDGNEAEDYCIEGALASNYIHNRAEKTSNGKSHE